MRVPSKTRKKIEWLLRRAEGALLPTVVLEAEGAHLDPADARTKLETSPDEVALVGVTARLEELSRAIASGSADLVRAYADAHGLCGVQRFHAGERTHIYLLEVETF